MKLLISRRLPESVMADAEARFDVTCRSVTTPMDHDECVAALADYDMVLPTLGDAFRADAFAAVPEPRCKLLANFGVGYNHIDVAAAEAAGVAVTNTPGAVTDATADIAMTLILMTARRAGRGSGWSARGMDRLAPGADAGPAPDGQDRRGDRHGPDRAGDRASLPLRVRLPDRLCEPLAEGGGHPGRAIADADRACRGGCGRPGDTGGAETHHLMGSDEFAMMKPSAIFVNISRGDVVDEAALVAALSVKRIAGAGLDVYEFEPQVPEELLAMENVTLLPHLGTAALEVREAMGRMAMDNVMAFAEGRDLPNPV
jgi:lactate dehydrogenase-like 2-hydroxyacid dehydrogenase